MARLEDTRQISIAVTKCSNELNSHRSVRKGSKRSHHLAAVVRADHVIKRLLGDAGRHEGGGAVVKDQAAIGYWTTAGRARAADGLEKGEVSIVAGAGVRAALPLLWGPENHLADFFSVFRLQFGWFLGFWSSGEEAGAGSREPGRGREKRGRRRWGRRRGGETRFEIQRW